MNYSQIKAENGPFVSVVKGVAAFFLCLIFLTIILGCLTNLGWTGLLHWTGKAYLLMVYLSLTSGSILAGIYSRNLGWVAGMGVGVLTSFILLFCTLLSGEGVKWGYFILKVIINCFIGAFGGIIGINISKK